MATLSLGDKSHNEHAMQHDGSHGGCFRASETCADIYDNDHINNRIHAPDPTPTPGPISVSGQETAVYDGFKFFKADSIPGQKATWTRVERTQMHLSQSEFYHMVQKRATKISSAKQYLTLSHTRRAHVNKLIHEQRNYEPQFEWSCVYAKERTSPRDDQGVASMDVILMRRPMRTRPNPRTPMGDLVDLDVPFRLNENNEDQGIHERPESKTPRIMQNTSFRTLPSKPLDRRIRACAPDQEGKPGPVVQGPLPRPLSVTLPLTGLELGQGKIIEALSRNSDTLNEHTRSEPSELDHGRLDWSSEASSDEDRSTISDDEGSDVSSTVEEAETTIRDRERSSNPSTSCSRKSRSPDLHGQRLLYGRNAAERNMDSMGRCIPLRPDHIDMTTARNASSAKRAWSQCAGNEDSQPWEKRYRVQRIDEAELRSRLLACEARIERWEGAFTRQTQILHNAVAENTQLRRSRTFWDFSSMRHCGCQCPRDGKIGNKD